jgi:hypothetical protein
MNHRIAGIVALLSCWLCVSELMAESPYAKIDRLRSQRGLGKVTIRVVDSTGKPVSTARMSGAFWPSDSSADVDVFEGQTDTNGLFVATGETIHSMNYTITKDGYYRTTETYWFRRQREECLQDGRWQPWNPTNTVMLKEHRNPTPMYAKRIDVPIPKRDALVGFDLEVGDWMAPDGKGKETDILIAYTAMVQDYWNYSNQLIIVCSNKLNGLYRDKKDMWSDFRSTYEANSDGYQPQCILSFATTKQKTLKDQRLGDSEYLVFRVRTVLDDKGNIVSARYGKIYGPIEYGESDTNHGGIRFTYYLNPTPNDRNLEFDPARNLFGPDVKPRVYQP